MNGIVVIQHVSSAVFTKFAFDNSSGLLHEPVVVSTMFDDAWFQAVGPAAYLAVGNQCEHRAAIVFQPRTRDMAQTE